MRCFEILKQIDNGVLHTTKGIYPLNFDEEITQEQNHEQLKAEAYYCAILDFINEQAVTGDKETINDYLHYSNLRLTKGGKNLLRWSKLTVDDIDNSSGKDSIKIWLFRPVVAGVCQALIIAVVSFMVGFYFSDIKGMLSTPQTNSQQETQGEQNKPNQNTLNEKTKDL